MHFPYMFTTQCDYSAKSCLSWQPDRIFMQKNFSAIGLYTQMCYHVPMVAHIVDIKMFLLIDLKGKDYRNFKTQFTRGLIFQYCFILSFFLFPLYFLSPHFGKYDLKIY